MKIQVFSKIAIEDFKTNKKHIVISVRSPKSKIANLPNQKSRLNALFLAFHDVDERCLQISATVDCDVCGGSGYIEEYRHIENGRCFKCNRDGLDIKLFSKKNARDILNFIKEYKNDIDLIAINCEAGISRSAGIAGALSKIYNNDDSYFFKKYLPNSLVYRLILNEYYED